MGLAPILLSAPGAQITCTGGPVAVERGRDYCLDLPAVVQDGAGEDLVGAIGQARQPGHLVPVAGLQPSRPGMRRT